MRDGIAALTAEMDGVTDPADAPALLSLLRLLYRVGRRDLPLGRLFEGHVDALQIVSRYGNARQRSMIERAVEHGGAFGVWNADLPGERLRIEDGRLVGGKSFASGAGILSHALVSVDADGGRQLVLLALDDESPSIDRRF